MVSGTRIKAAGLQAADQREIVNHEAVEILRTIYPALLRTAAFLVDWDEREDLAQDALLATLRVHRGFSGLQDPLRYTRTVMVRLAAGSRRASSLRRGSLLQLPDTPASLDVEGTVLSALELRRLLMVLPARQRACAYLTYVEGLTDRQAADVLGCRPSSVRAHLVRARRALVPTLTQEQ